jgi:hypothetical protein
MYNNGSYVSLAEAEYLGEPTSGDFDMGAGVSTSQLQNPNVSLKSSKQNNAPAWQQSPGAWVMLLVLLVVCKLIAERAGKESEFATVRIGLENWLLVGLMAATFIYAGKMVFFMVKFAPLTQFFGAI